MRTTVAIDDDLIEKARLMTGVSETTALIREGLQALIQRESARRLAKLGGTEKNISVPPRRRGPRSLCVRLRG
jgi:Arc/MetJ family transcription regulator